MGTTIMHSGRQFAGGGSEVVANPSATPTDELEKIRIGDMVYDIPGTGVEANPPDTPTDHLESIKIGDSTYDIPGGGGGSDLEMEISNGSIQATYGETVEETDDILKDSTGQTIMSLLDDIAESVGLLGNSELLAPIVYSEEEREVGVWTDGKPIYQKTIDCGLMPKDTNWHDVAHGISDIDRAISIDSIVFSSVQSIVQEFSGSSAYRPSRTEGIIAIRYEEYIRFMNNWQDANTGHLYVTLKYTKTTDLPGSGKYTTLGGAAVHYSTNEQVIGTYFGKTLYRKGFTYSSATFSSQQAVLTNNLTGILEVVNIGGSFYEPRDGRYMSLQYFRKLASECLYLQTMVLSDHSVSTTLVTNTYFYQTLQDIKIWIEYTKTT